MADAYIYESVRTPFGRYGGQLAGVRPDDLAAHVLRGLVERAPSLDPATIDEVMLGNANGAGEENRNVARMAAILAGLPTSVPGVTVNRLCGSGLEAAIQAARAIETGDVDIAIAGGVESMSRAPWVVTKPEQAYARGDQAMHSTTVGWRMVNPRMPEQWTVSLGGGAEILAERYSVSREEQDRFALRSHALAHSAWDQGRYADDVLPVPGTGLQRDENIRPGGTLEKLATLKPSYTQDGSVTAANSSPLTDGASALLIGNADAEDQIGHSPLARIASRAVAGVDPDVFGIGPVEASERALVKAGIGWGDLSVVEINEAFAAQVLACFAQWPDLDPAIVNPNGGAIALGHPLGATGGRLLGTLARELKRTGGRWGLATACIGVGQGLAVVLDAG